MGDFFGPIARRESRRNYSDRFAQSRPAFIAAEKPGPNPLARRLRGGRRGQAVEAEAGGADREVYRIGTEAPPGEMPPAARFWGQKVRQ